MSQKQSQNLFKFYKEENDYVAHFFSVIEIKVDNLFSPDLVENTIKAPDYILNNNIYIEVTKLYDGKDIKISAQWARIINKLQKIVSAKISETDIKGLFSVHTPREIKISKDKQFGQIASDIIAAVANGQKEITSCKFVFTIEKINEDQNEIYLTSSWGGVMNPAGTIFQNINKKLNIANKQLGYPYGKYKINKKYLLIVNKYVYADRISEAIEGLSYCYADLLKYENIDEIWFQQEVQGGSFKHSLIFSRDFVVNFDKKSVDPDNKTHQGQFELWYWALDKMGVKQDELFDALKKFLEKHRPEDIFPDKFKREAMVRLGIWLVESNRANDAIWLIKNFINDPDPGKPNEYSGDDKFDYHKQLENNEDPTIITTVMGHLAWTVQSLARKSTERDSKNLIEAYQFTEKVLTNTNNLYVIQQWMVPLSEIANRRWWLLKNDLKLYKRFRKLLLDKDSGLVAKCGHIPGIAKYMANIFSYFKDLTTEEAKLVLEKISVVDQSMPVLIYFAIYRLLHYKKETKFGKKVSFIDKKILDYSPKGTTDLLNKIIVSRSKKYLVHKSTIAWNFWKILEEDKKQLPLLENWVDLLICSGSLNIVLTHITRIIDDVSEYNFNKSLEWYEKSLTKLKADIIPKMVPASYEPFWFEKLLKNIAEKKPEKLQEVVTELFELNEKHQIYIGEIKKVLETYQFINDKEIKKETTNKFITLSKRIKNKSIVINWDL